jgi:hypothetical protein
MLWTLFVVDGIDTLHGIARIKDHKFTENLYNRTLAL